VKCRDELTGTDSFAPPVKFERSVCYGGGRGQSEMHRHHVAEWNAIAHRPTQYITVSLAALD
jgi:hypothetical protein